MFKSLPPEKKGQIEAADILSEEKEKDGATEEGGDLSDIQTETIKVMMALENHVIMEHLASFLDNQQSGPGFLV